MLLLTIFICFFTLVGGALLYLPSPLDRKPGE
jgi:hypothetical protein